MTLTWQFFNGITFGFEIVEYGYIEDPDDMESIENRIGLVLYIGCFRCMIHRP